MHNDIPPFTVTTSIIRELTEITRLLGILEGRWLDTPSPKLRRSNQIRTVHASVGIEGNTLTEAQITAILDGKRVVGHAHEIREVQNALRAYQMSSALDPFSETDFLKAHGVLTEGILNTPGVYRHGNVGIQAGNKLTHIAPPAHRVPQLMCDLFAWIKSTDQHPIITSCVFHYELEFIHPFLDGNGRIGRLWHHILLLHVNPLFDVVPFESVIAARQDAYYAALSASDAKANSTSFIDFCLSAIMEAIREIEVSDASVALDTDMRIQIAQQYFGDDYFSRKNYMQIFKNKNISTSTASRDLKYAVDGGTLEALGMGRTRRYRFFCFKRLPVKLLC